MAVDAAVDSVLLRHAVRTVRAQLGPRYLPMETPKLEDHVNWVTNMVRTTVEAGESNSALLIGARGTGKSMVVDKALNAVRSGPAAVDGTSAESSAAPVTRSRFLEVRLNGLVQTDDTIALKEIARQLRLGDQLEGQSFNSFAETLAFLLEVLRKGSRESSMAIIFVLDEFDLFAHSHKQTLLYNLFDIAQSAQNPVCVIGLSCRLDVMDLLEKRVKSRFSHRQLHFYTALTFEEYVGVVKERLNLPAESMGPSTFFNTWNEQIDAFLEASPTRKSLRGLYSKTKDLRELFKIVMVAATRVSLECSFLKPEDVEMAYIEQYTDAKEAMLCGVSILELCMVIAAKRICERYERQTFNFEMIYQEYKDFATGKSEVDFFVKAVALKAFEHLVKIELFTRADAKPVGKTMKEYCLMNLVVETSQIREALMKYQDCPTAVQIWAFQEVSSNRAQRSA